MRVTLLEAARPPLTRGLEGPEGVVGSMSQPQSDGGPSFRVMIVDDHQTFAELLALALSTEDDFECTGIAADGASAYDLAVRTEPNVVVMDIQLGGESGLDAARRIREALPDVVVVVVSAHGDPTSVAKASHAGASAFVPKSGSLSEMLSMVRLAKNGTMLVAPSLFEQVTALGAAQAPGTKLTNREYDVLVLMGQGAAPRQIARELNISLNTCRGYVKAVHAKLGVRSQLEAVVRAQSLGLINISNDR